MTVYFIGGDFGAVKIGFTGDDTPDSRLAALQTGCPFELRAHAFCPGSEADETSLHDAFEDQWLRGEWFRATPRLMTLIAFVEQHGTLDGWREAIADPQKHADFVATIGSPVGFEALGVLPISEIAWAQFRGKPRTFDDKLDWDRISYWWRNIAAGDSVSVSHFVSSREWAPTIECYWLHQSGTPAFFNAAKGLELTALALGEAVTADEVAAAWIQACVRDYCGRDQRAESAALLRLVPEVRRLVELSSEIMPVTWHPMCTDTVPLPLCIPEHAALSAQEFVRLCALNYVATSARYSVRAVWADGAACEWPRRQAVAA